MVTSNLQAQIERETAAIDGLSPPAAVKLLDEIERLRKLEKTLYELAPDLKGDGLDEFDGHFVAWHEVIEACVIAWDEKVMYDGSPFELITRIIDERDEALTERDEARKLAPDPNAEPMAWLVKGREFHTPQLYLPKFKPFADQRAPKYGTELTPLYAHPPPPEWRYVETDPPEYDVEVQIWPRAVGSETATRLRPGLGLDWMDCDGDEVHPELWCPLTQGPEVTRD